MADSTQCRQRSKQQQKAESHLTSLIAEKKLLGEAALQQEQEKFLKRWPII
jgi:hypothetical protein